MDPTSIVGLLSSIVTLSGLLNNGLTGLHNFIRQARNVDETIESLYADIDALSMIGCRKGKARK